MPRFISAMPMPRPRRSDFTAKGPSSSDFSMPIATGQKRIEPRNSFSSIATKLNPATGFTPSRRR